MRISFLFFFYILTLFPWLPAQEGEKKYVWPLAIHDGISSTFQEFRSSHFHAGIDLRTFQRTGFPVLAVSDGVIARISVSNRNFGRCLYLNHADGRYSLYGHLEKFRADIETQVAQIQLSRGKKYFDTCALPMPVAVRRGEIIAFSGESGAGFAHLHLEIRDQLDRALNPLSLIGNLTPDENEPRLKGILLRSRGLALLNDDCGEFYFKLRKAGTVYTLAEPLTFTGPFDLAIHAFDLSDASHIVAPYSVDAWLDGQPVFGVAFDSLTRDDNNQLGMLYDMAHSTPGVYFINIGYQSGFALEKTGVRLAERLQKIPLGLHELRIVVKDRQLNQAVAAIPLLKVLAIESSRQQKEHFARKPDNGIMQRTEFSTFVNHDDIIVKVRDFPLPAVLLKLKITQGDREQVVPAHECGEGVFFCFKPLNQYPRLVLRFELSDGRQIVEVKQEVLQALLLKNNFAQTVHFQDFAAEFGPGTVLEPAVLLLEQVALRPEFPLLAGPVKSAPVHFAFLDAVRFKFRIPNGADRLEQLGIFKYRSESKKWSYVATRPDLETGYLSCRVLTAGTFALLRDIFPPVISFPRIGSRYMQKLKRLVAHISDRGKGIEDSSLAVLLNGHDVDAEYDPDWGHVLITDLQYVKKGKNSLLLRVGDRAGNLSEKNFTFSLK